jgi:NarL family two-component system response regulator LiaR
VIRVLIVDDHQVVREGLRFVLEQEPDVEVVGEAGDGRAALEAIRKLVPDVVLLDMLMPVLDGKRVLDALRAGEPGPTPAVVVLTSHPGDDEAIDAVRAGALSYLPKSAAIDRVTEAVRAAAAGGSILDPGVTALLVSQLRERGGDGPLARLSARERDVLATLARGRSNREIARELSISEQTVKSYVSSILAKLGLQDRTQAAIFGLQQGLIPLDEALRPRELAGWQRGLAGWHCRGEADPEHTQLQRERRVVAHQGGELEGRAAANDRNRIGVRRVVHVAVPEHRHDEPERGPLMLVREGRHATGPKGFDLRRAQPGGPADRLVSVALEGTVPVGRDGQDRHLTDPAAQRRPVPDYRAQLLQGLPNGRGGEHGVERAMQPPFRVGERDQSRAGRPGAADDGVVQGPLRVIEIGGGVVRKACRHPSSVARVGRRTTVTSGLRFLRRLASDRLPGSAEESSESPPSARSGSRDGASRASQDPPGVRSGAVATVPQTIATLLRGGGHGAPDGRR